MRDEKYVFLTDCREKKSTANSAFKKRTHTGKGGRVRFPSDNLSKKELQKMNGETKSYRLNDPMSWQEFRAMPDDLKVMYIKLLREKFNVPVRRLAVMMGVDSSCLNREIIRLGIGEGKHSRAGNTPWDKEGFYAWCGLLPKEAVNENATEEAQEAEPEGIVEPELTAEENAVEEVKPVAVPARKAIPMTGSMVFEGLAEDVLETVRVLLGGANVHISITWDVLDDGERKDNG